MPAPKQKGSHQVGRRTARRLIAVGGGKGGVGKSVIAANLGVAIAQAGFRAILVDADLGAANQHTLFGIDRPGPGLQSLLTHEIDTLEAAVCPTGVKGLHLVPGSSAIAGAANINHQQKQKLLRHILALEAEVVVIDVGAGVSFNVIDFFDLADQRLVVMTPQLTSIQNAYAFMKGAVFREIRRQGREPAHVAALEEAIPDRETDRVGDVLGRLRQADGELADAISSALQRFGARIVGNQVFDARDAGTFHAVSRMMRDFLNLTVPVLGFLRSSRRLHDSVNARRPFLVDATADENAAAIRAMAETLLLEDVEKAGPHSALAELEQEAQEEKPTEEQRSPNIDPYMRRLERKLIDWAGILELEGQGPIAVRVLDVSLGGVGIVLPERVAIGQTGRLVFDEFEEQPSIGVMVKNVQQDESRAGLMFLTEGELPARLVAAAAEDSSPTPR